jgi:hypothetical protein
LLLEPLPDILAELEVVAEALSRPSVSLVCVQVALFVLVAVLDPDPDAVPLAVAVSLPEGVEVLDGEATLLPVGEEVGKGDTTAPTE